MSKGFSRLRKALTIVLVGSWACLTPAARAASSVDGATSGQSGAASDAYRAGAEAYAAEKYTDALALFRKSYELVASPNSHLMIARALAKLERNAEAYTEYDGTVREAEDAAEKNEKYKKTAETARNERDELKSKVAFVVVELDAAVTLGGRALSPDELGKPLVVPSGKTEVVLRLPGGAEEHRAIDAEPGAPTRVQIAPKAPVAVAPPAPVACPPPPPKARPGIDQTVLAVVAGGVGAVGFATFAVFGVLDQNEFSDLKRRCPGNVCSGADSSALETGRTYQTLANVGLGVGIVGVVSGLALLFTTPHDRPAPSRATGATIQLAVSPGAVGVFGGF